MLVLATLWPKYWDTLTTRTEPDRHAQARELLGGHRIRVPDAFTGAALGALTQAASADPRLGEAAEHASDGQVTQYLAGVPVLMSHYEDALPAAKALIHAAMDARRLGAGPHIPLAWLAEAAPGYLTEAEWNQSGDDWLEQALHYVTKPCNGIPGILTAVKTDTPATSGTAAPAPPLPGIGPGPGRARCTDWPTTSTSTAAGIAPTRCLQSTSGPQPPPTPTPPTWEHSGTLPGTEASTAMPPSSTSTPPPTATPMPRPPSSSTFTSCTPQTTPLPIPLPKSPSKNQRPWPSCCTT